jgi:hypothetical protein
MARQLVERLHAMATIMQHVDGLTKASMSKTHTEHVIKVINRSSFTMSELDELGKAAVAVALMTDDKERVLQALSAKYDAKALGPSETPGADLYQNYESAAHFVPQRVWEKIKEGSSDNFFELLAKLGLRSPSEATFQAMAIIFMVAGDGEDKALSLSVESKNHVVKAVKKWWKKYIAWPTTAPGRALEWIAKLPPTSSELLKECPTTYHLAYIEDTPSPCPISVSTMSAMRETTRMRMGRVSKAAAPTPPSMMEAISQFMPALMQVMMPAFGQLQGMQGHAGSPLNLQFPQRPALRTPLMLQCGEEEVSTPCRSSSSSSLSSFTQSSPVLPRAGTWPAAPNEPVLQPLPADVSQLEVPHDDAVGEGCRKVDESVLQWITPIKATSSTKSKLSVSEAAAVVAEAYASKARSSQRVMKRPAAALHLADEKDLEESPPKKLGKCGEKPNYCHEKSRLQFLARTGIKGKGQSTQFPYTNAATMKTAESKAKEFCRCELAKRGFPADVKYK